MSSDRLVNFLYLYGKWSQGVFAKGILISFMVIIITIILVIVIGDDSADNRRNVESTLSLLVNMMIFVAGIGFGVIAIVPLIMNKLQEKV